MGWSSALALVSPWSLLLSTRYPVPSFAIISNCRHYRTKRAVGTPKYPLPVFALRRRRSTCKFGAVGESLDLSNHLRGGGGELP